MLTDAPKSIKGVVLAVGPGKWVEGTWWKEGGTWVADKNGIHHKVGGEWGWIPGYREPMEVKLGDIVLFSSRWNDLAHAEFKGSGADGNGPLERPLSYRLDPLVHLVREADIIGKIYDINAKVYFTKTQLEEKFFQNRTIAETA